MRKVMLLAAIIALAMMMFVAPVVLAHAGHHGVTRNGGNGPDSLFGTAHNDTLRGGNGPDDLRGRGANDLLNGGSANDYMNGGKGRDVCVVDSAGDVVLSCRVRHQ